MERLALGDRALSHRITPTSVNTSNLLQDLDSDVPRFHLAGDNSMVRHGRNTVFFDEPSSLKPVDLFTSSPRLARDDDLAVREPLSAGRAPPKRSTRFSTMRLSAMSLLRDPTDPDRRTPKVSPRGDPDAPLQVAPHDPPPQDEPAREDPAAAAATDANLDLSLPMFAAWEVDEGKSLDGPTSIGRVLAEAAAQTRRSVERTLRLNITRGVPLAETDDSAREDLHDQALHGEAEQSHRNETAHESPRATADPNPPSPTQSTALPQVAPMYERHKRGSVPPLYTKATRRGAAGDGGHAASNAHDRIKRGVRRLKKLVPHGHHKHSDTDSGEVALNETGSPTLGDRQGSQGSRVSDMSSTLSGVSDGSRKGRAPALRIKRTSRKRRSLTGAPPELCASTSSVPGVPVRVLWTVPTVTAPELTHVSFGEHWSKDLFGLLHNALRREIRDLYDILGSMMTTSGSTLYAEEKGMMSAFFGWWQAFQQAVLEVIRAEETIIFPWMETAVFLAPPLDRDSRKQSHQNIRKSMQAATSARRVVEERQDPDALVALYGHISDSVRKLVELMWNVEEHVPTHLTMFFRQGHKAEIDVTVRQELTKGACPQLVFPMLLRGIPTVEGRKAWAEEMMRGPRRMMLTFWCRACDAQHFRLARKLANLDRL